MAMTLHAQQIRQLKAHFDQSTTNFRNKVLALRALFCMRYLGIPTRRWAAKKLFWLQTDPQFISADPVEQAERIRMLDELAEKNELALKKQLTRVSNKQKAAAAAAAPAAAPAQGPTPWD
jgi:hypothetical protein